MTDIFAYLIIPAYTILFAWDTNWFTTNFSVIGTMDHKNNAFLIWGIMIECYFFFTMNRILKWIPSGKKEAGLVIMSELLLALAVFIPYLPEQLPVVSFLHVIFAFFASVLLLFSLYLILWKLTQIDSAIYRPYLNLLILSTAVSGVILMAAGIVSSALEIYFTISLVVLVRRLDKRLSGN